MKTAISFLSILLAHWCLAQNFEKSLSGSSSRAYDEGEAHIVQDPSNSKNMAIAYMESGNGPVRFRLYHSEDGGNSWALSSLNTHAIARAEFPFLQIVGGGDILMSYDKNGKLYASWIHLMGNPSSPGGIDSVRWLSFWGSSTDNGATFSLEDSSKKYWGQGKISLRSGYTVRDFKNGITDRQWMVTDLTDGKYSNRLYMGFINYTHILDSSGLRVITKDANEDQFSTYSTAYKGSGQFTNLAIDKKGGLHYTFCDVDSNFVYHTSSTDGGKSFSPAHLIYKGRDLAPTSTYTHRRENAAPSLTIDQKDNLHLVWGDFQGNQSPLSYYSKSTDHGQTWSVPLPLDSLFGNPVFMPVLSSYGNKITIGANVLDGQKRSSFQILTSLDNGVSFGNPVSQASSSTNLNQHYSNFHGDYTTSFRTACEVYSLWTDCRSSECVLYLARYNECMAASVDNTPIVSHLRLTQVYPNPVHDNLTLVFESKSKNELEINLYSLTGQHLLNTKHFEIEGGRNEISLDFGDLPGGNYILNIKDAHGLFFTRNIMKE